MAASLASAAINVGALRELARRELVELLDSVRAPVCFPLRSQGESAGVCVYLFMRLLCVVVVWVRVRTLLSHERAAAAAQVRGKKALVLDPKVAGPLGLIAEYSLLKARASPSVCLPLPFLSLCARPSLPFRRSLSMLPPFSAHLCSAPCSLRLCAPVAAVASRRRRVSMPAHSQSLPFLWTQPLRRS
jgi:hypothetical protein